MKGSFVKVIKIALFLCSAKIGYYVLMILSGLILFISEGVSDLNAIKNYPLLIVVCLTFLIPPVVEFFYIRKYK